VILGTRHEPTPVRAHNAVAGRLFLHSVRSRPSSVQANPTLARYPSAVSRRKSLDDPFVRRAARANRLWNAAIALIRLRTAALRAMAEDRQAIQDQRADEGGDAVYELRRGGGCGMRRGSFASRHMNSTSAFGKFPMT
jgi:hypothetical protein